MKTIFLLNFYSLFALSSVFSQTISEVPLEKLDTEYISIADRDILGRRQVAVYLDFGQPREPFYSKDTQIKDPNGKPMEFNSMIEVLNLLNTYGYELVTVISSGSENQIHEYLMRKKRDDIPGKKSK